MSESNIELSAEKLLELVLIESNGQYRSGQAEMVRAVEEAQNFSAALMVQAGTGTGKSLGYLIPSVLTALKQQERVIISTATLALQRQIVSKDAVVISKVLEEQFDLHPQVSVLKGWHHYLCRYKLDGGYPSDELTLELNLGFPLVDKIHKDANFRNEAKEKEKSSHATGVSSRMIGKILSQSDPLVAKNESFGDQLKRVYAWAEYTDSGDRDDLIPGVSNRVWANVSVTAMECIREACPFQAECFAATARIKANKSDLVVTNHAMLGIELASGNRVLPFSEHLVVDEAHLLPDRVTSQLTYKISLPGLLALVKKVRKAGEDVSEIERLIHLFEGVSRLLPIGRLPAAPWPDPVSVVFSGLETEIDRLLVSLQGKRSDKKKLTVFTVACAALGEYKQILQVFRSEKIIQGDFVAWTEGKRAGDDTKEGNFIISNKGEIYVPTLRVAPLDVTAKLQDRLYADKSVVLTSATLYPGGKPEVGARGIGIHILTEWQHLDVGSPFEYQKQAILYNAVSLPAPSSHGMKLEVLEEIKELLEASNGGALGLFTSVMAANSAAEYMRSNTDLPILIQGDDQIPTLVNEFKLDPKACLFGTASLWQGIDVPGLTLRLVIIDRIPFERPDDPLMSARYERAKQAGRNGFMQVYLPVAALNLAQGVGRLIRSSTDLGVVAILDSRLGTKSYGKFILDSLPDMFWTPNKAQVLESIGKLARIALLD